MKQKLILFLAAVVIAFASCQKKETPTPAATNNTGGGGSGTVPSSFTKKVLIEEFTGAWCGYCPDGAYKMQTIVDNSAGKVIGVSIHEGDAMEISLYNSLDAIF